jgi:hypothetical protein
VISPRTFVSGCAVGLKGTDRLFNAACLVDVREMVLESGMAKLVDGTGLAQHTPLIGVVKEGEHPPG